MERSTDLASLSEKDLREFYLIPLFIAMGFQEVEHWHGGSNEKGKDIVMWRHDALGHPENYAVVVKKGNLTGSAGNLTNDAGTVATQIRQCFGAPFFSKSSTQPRNVDKCFVVASGKIGKDTRDAINSVVSERSQYVNYIPGDELQILIQKHLPHRNWLQVIRNAHQSLSSSQPLYDLSLITSPDGQQILFHPKDDTTPYPEISYRLLVDPNIEKNLKSFAEAGGTLRVPNASIISFQSTIPLEEFGINPHPEGSDLVVSQVPESNGYFTLEKTFEGGVARFESIELFLVQGGSKQFRLETSKANNRAIELKVDVRLLEGLSAVTISLTLSPRDKNVADAHRAALFAAALSKPGKFRIVQSHTGLNIESRADVQGDFFHPFVDPSYIEMLGQLEEIQVRTGTIILLKRDVTEDDLKNIRKAYIATTQKTFEVDSFAIVSEPTAFIDPKVYDSYGRISILPGANPMSDIISILDTKIDLGAPEIRGENVRLKIENAEPPTGDAPFGTNHIQVESEKDSAIYMSYPRFFKTNEPANTSDTFRDNPPLSE